jgi:hypothetical protein
MGHEQVSRRKFMRDSAAVAASMVVGIGQRTAKAGNKSATKKPLNYNENMEYRRLGKTDLTR